MTSAHFRTYSPRGAGPRFPAKPDASAFRLMVLKRPLDAPMVAGESEWWSGGKTVARVSQG